MLDHTFRYLPGKRYCTAKKYGVGQPVRRKEDDTLVRGKGKYTDDFNLPGQLYAFMVRSSHAHGLIRSIDIPPAAKIDARRARKSGPAPTWQPPATPRSPAACPLKNPRRLARCCRPTAHPLMTDKVRYVGDPIAFVVAENPGAGRATPPKRWCWISTRCPP